MIVKTKLGLKGLLEARMEKRKETLEETFSEKGIFDKVDFVLEYPME